MSGKALICDDAAFMRSIIRRVLSFSCPYNRDSALSLFRALTPIFTLIFIGSLLFCA